MDCEARWEFESCGGNNVEFQREQGLFSTVYEESYRVNTISRGEVEEGTDTLTPLSRSPS
jgi:hypothetical protein